VSDWFGTAARPWDNRQVDRLVDLDAVVAILDARRAGWKSRGLQVGAFTWRDAQALWPKPIVTDRALVADPESLGMKMDAPAGRFAELVLWCGGWADLDYVIDDQIQSEVPRFRDVAECAAVAERLADLLLSGAQAPDRPTSTNMTTAKDDPDRVHESQAEAPAPAAETPTRLQQAGAGMTEAQAWKGQQIAQGWRKLVNALRRREEGAG
jgi:hypothetical protein